jgi:serine/threonine protein kinase/tetratricopeptide (TPR) repeat protein
MQCPKCNLENPPSASVCGRCGLTLNESNFAVPGDNDAERTLAGKEELAGKNPTGPVSSETSEDWAAPRSVSGGIAPARLGTLEPGTMLGERYEILAMLGQGGMGAVYKARDRELDRLVALKVIRPELTTNPEILKRFKQELILARQVTHRNVIRIFDLGQADGLKFITMDFLEGQDLRAELKKRGKFSPQEAARIILQMSRALEVAHGEGVVHRDLKPQNIMLDASGRAYVMDFGIARSAYLPGMTQTGALIGTPEYMSPEQAKGEKLDERSDLFSLGVIFYELLTGSSPYYSDTPLATLWKRMQEKAKPLTEIDPAIPKEISDIVAKLLEIEVANRFQTAGELAWRLESWLGISNPALTATSTIALSPPKSSFSWGWVAAGVALLLTAGGVAIWLARPAKPKVAHTPVSVLVADFTNHTGDPIFDGTLEPMFNVALEGASFVNAYNRGSARKLAQRLPNPSDKLDEQPARLVAIGEGVGAVVTGELSRRGDQYTVSATALDAVTGNVIAKSEVTAANKDSVLLSIPKLAAPIRKALGDATPESVQITSAGGAFQSASLEAVHQYGIAMDQEFAGKMNDAFNSFSKAAELDPNFARAYSGMAAVAGNLGHEQDADKYFKLALQHVDRMTERERYRIRGLYYLMTENWQKCIEENSELTKQYPADNMGHNNLSICYKSEHNTPKAIEELKRSLEVAPNNQLRVNLALYLSYTGDFQAAEREARAVLQVNPNFETGYAALAYAQIGQDQFDTAIQTYQRLERTSSFGQSMAAPGLADIAIYQGRLTDAVHLLETAASADIQAGRLESAAADFGLLAYAQLLRKQKASALAAVERALANSKSISTRLAAGRIYASTGETVKAQKLAESLASETQLEAPIYAKLIGAEVALQQKDPRHAIQMLNDANKQLDTWIGRFDLGRAYLEAGLFPEADGEFDRCIKRRGETLDLFDYVSTYGYVPEIYYDQGKAREGLNSPGFRDSYRTYLSIREKAGEDPLLPEIRRRLGA